jgi:hypothetical protein
MEILKTLGQPKPRISRLQNLQTLLRQGKNHPDPKTRLMLRVFSPRQPSKPAADKAQRNEFQKFSLKIMASHEAGGASASGVHWFIAWP